MDIPTIAGALYTVASKTTCDITDTATGTPIDSVTSGSVTFTAQGSVTTLSDPAATYTKVNFKNAAAALRMLGGGDNLPSGYLAAEFLEFGGKDKYIEVTTPWTPAGARVEVKSYERFYRIDVTSDEIGNGSHANYFFWGVKNSSGPKWYVGCGTYGTTSFAADTNWHNMRLVYAADGGCWVDELKVRDCSFNANSKILRNFRLGATAPTVNELFYPAYTWVKKCALWVDGEKWRDVHAAIDPSGKPCFFDKVEKQPFYNGTETALTVGMTLAQARQLSKLPAGGGSLKISLPENYTDDEAVVAALSTATENGWVFEIQTYTTDGAEASTFALRRIWVKKIDSPDGPYVDATGARWHVEWCQTVLGAEPSDLGYEPFRSVDVALAEWELTPYVYPEEENLSI